jgi:SNF2 family DNA or RNA helicase
MLFLLTADTLPIVQLFQYTQSNLVNQGRELHRLGCAHVEQATGTSAEISVEPPSHPPQRVVVGLSGQQVYLTCTCRFNAGWGLCQHRVAAILALQDHLRAHPPSIWRAVLDQTVQQPVRRTTIGTSSGAIFFSLQQRGQNWSVVPYSLTGRALPHDHQGDPEQLAALIEQRAGAQVRVIRSQVDSSIYRSMPLHVIAAANTAVAAGSNFSYWHTSERIFVTMLAMLPNCLVYLGDEQNPIAEGRVFVHEAPAQVELEISRREAALGVQFQLLLADRPITLSSARSTILVRDPTWMLVGDQIFRLADGSPSPDLLTDYAQLTIPASEAELFFDRYMLPLSEHVPIHGDAVTWETVAAEPERRVYLTEHEGSLVAELCFAYAGVELPLEKQFPEESVRRRAGSTTFLRIKRNSAIEQDACQFLASSSGLKKGGERQFALRKNVAPADFLLREVPKLASSGFAVFGEEALTLVRVNRSRPTVSFHVNSGFDWFDVEAVVRFGEQTLPVKELKRALKRRDRYIKLADGSLGAIPEEWAERYRHLFAFSEEQGERLRLSNHHVSLLDQLLTEADRVQTDSAFAERREQLKSFDQIEAQPLPHGFTGSLRPYQKAGYDWLHFLRRYRFGGCLADDMGMGKCVAATTRIFVNDALQTAEAIWTSYARAPRFDGEGEWAEPTAPLWVNALDEQRGRMVLAPVRRLYRQRVQERLRRIRLEDGRSITITTRHRLLTLHDSWTTQLRPGDYVGVPARLVCRTDSMAFSPEPRMAVMALASAAVAPQVDRAASSLPGQDLHFRRIVAVDEVSYKGWVYDLEVAKHHNFVAEQILCHNTIQALAFLQAIYEEQPRPASSLIVMPRSLLFNWQREAAQFTPNLNVYIHADQGRISEAAAFAQHDLILTTYGVMLRDIELLRAYRFHYAILDESQAIKNPLAETSRAARALQADQCLVLTGTPVENSTIELWSQFAFLNPGLLGNLDYFREQFAGPIERKQDVETATFLRKLVYPFILRRTKDQVALDLPPRSEELLITDMEPAQRKLYIKTRDYYRATLLGMIDNEGLDDSRMKILEGLLRLRQICNHPRLVDGKFRGSSAKFELLLETLQTLRAEGHKALIFSQFVQMLSLIREALDEQKIPYAYLDGSTHNRQGEVDRFQNSADLPFFLISLKAGGVGLNLTAADYVIHVDPWWNPAVELQATDRTHRIGQTKPVFVYKLITRDTVEEKILKLQEQKRALVSQLITTEGGVFKLLSRDDVEVLFS